MKEILSSELITAKKGYSTCTHLKLEGLWLLPAEVLAGEVTVLCCLEVDWLGQIKLLDNDTRSQVKVLEDDGNQFIGGLGRGTVGVDENGEWLCNTDGI